MLKKLILVVEDNTIEALVISRRLKRLGHCVIPYPVISGEAAIEKVEMLRPDLVLMDIKLKGEMDGIQAAEIISNRFGTPFIYINLWYGAGRNHALNPLSVCLSANYFNRMILCPSQNLLARCWRLPQTY